MYALKQKARSAGIMFEKDITQQEPHQRMAKDVTKQTEYVAFLSMYSNHPATSGNLVLEMSLGNGSDIP